MQEWPLFSFGGWMKWNRAPKAELSAPTFVAELPDAAIIFSLGHLLGVHGLQEIFCSHFLTLLNSEAPLFCIIKSQSIQDITAVVYCDVKSFRHSTFPIETLLWYG